MLDLSTLIILRGNHKQKPSGNIFPLLMSVEKRSGFVKQSIFILKGKNFDVSGAGFFKTF